MVKTWIVIVMFVFSVTALAQETGSKHMVMFGNNFSTEWNGSAGSFDLDSDSAIKDYDIGEGNFSLNYAYRIASQFQLGVHLKSKTEKEVAKARAGGKIEDKSSSSEVAVFGIINFSDKLEHAFYLGLALGLGKMKSESKDSTGGSTDKTDSDSDATIFQIAFGKRFPLTFMGIQNLTFSPSISYDRVNYSGDIKDANVNSLSAFTIDVVKFDLLF